MPEILSGKLNENVSIEMDYFSNAAESRVSIFKNVSGSRINAVISAILEEPTEVHLTVFKYSIKTVGTKAYISMKIDSKDDFGFYDVVVSNEIGLTFRLVEIIPKGNTHHFF